ncbi:MAG: FHA domain-containing protein [Symploca sp. SIO2E6]|nr:FHA domain-containing protein [Symploca sp. SIO2E6]
MITLILLNPIQSLPSQRWTFEPKSVIRIGRSTDNDVVLYSAVVSRHHVELRLNDASRWEIISIGANGTYIDERLITKMPVQDGMIIRLASSGPKIQIHVGGDITRTQKKAARSSYLDQSRDTLINVKDSSSEDENSL